MWIVSEQPPAWDELDDVLDGRLIRPGDERYAGETTGANLAAVCRPDAVVAAESPNDVSRAVIWAARHRIHVSVQATGHGAAEPIAGGILITTRRLDAIAVDPATRTATIGASARWEGVVAQAAEHGLHPIVGSSVDVGAVGYLLGGGIGPLIRSHGYSSDYLISAEVVTGSGELRHIAADTDPELLWALRGGKHGLGLVTEVIVRLLPITTIYGGTLVFGPDRMDEALRGWLAWTATADPRASTTAAFFRLPGDPGEQPQRSLAIHFAVPDDAEAGEFLAAPLRALGPQTDDLAARPTAAVAEIFRDPRDPSPSWDAGGLLGGSIADDDELADRLIGLFGSAGSAPFAATQLRHLGAAAAHDLPDGSAVPGRGARFVIGMIGIGPTEFLSRLPHEAAKARATLGPWLLAEINPNFSGAPDSDGRGPAHWEPQIEARLDAIRERADPGGIFA